MELRAGLLLRVSCYCFSLGMLCQASLRPSGPETLSPQLVVEWGDQSPVQLSGACTATSCVHGVCLDVVENGTHRCYCVNGYTGHNCATDYDDCRSLPCFYGGTCVDQVAGFRCTCVAGYTGSSCETDVDECRSNPCLNGGTCVDGAGSFVCECGPGYKGDVCEVDVSVCKAVTCFNGGMCIDGPGESFTCRCIAGFTGLLCEDDVDECLSRPCAHGGTCLNQRGSFLCSCVFGWTGRTCERAIEECGRNYCLNGGLCVVRSVRGHVNDTQFKPLVPDDVPWECFCVPDFHGILCERRYNECIPENACQNGGYCLDGVDDYSCACGAGFAGKYCEIPCLSDDNLCQDYTEVWSSYSPPATLPYLTFSVDEQTPAATTIHLLGTDGQSYSHVTPAGTRDYSYFLTPQLHSSASSWDLSSSLDA
ncbi:uncharacterized protein LOC144175571, partial [Haemaphysalis longicornis]